MRLNELINEGLSRVLYHSTTDAALNSILHDNRFRLSQTESEVSGSKNNKAGTYRYYMSFSRSRSNEYIRVAQMTVILTIDGAKLSQRYVGEPIDFFHHDAGATTKFDEMEDRLLSNRQFITNAGQYIRRIEILLPSVYFGPNYTVGSSRFKSYYMYKTENANKMGIDIRYYIGRDDFLNGNLRKSYDYDGIVSILDNKQATVLSENIGFDNWVVPAEATLKREYHVEVVLKGRQNLFTSLDDFLEKVKHASVMSVTDSEDRKISNRSRTKNKEDLIDLVSSYRSWPEFRNEKTVDAIYDGFKNNSPMELPIVVEFGNRRFVLTGNTRMDIAFHLGIEPKVLLVKI